MQLSYNILQISLKRYFFFIYSISLKQITVLNFIFLNHVMYQMKI